MQHWAEKYLDEKWTEEKDCFYWFRVIQRKEFKRDIMDIARNGNKLLFAMHNFVDDSIKRFGWVKTQSPQDGDAALMTKKKIPTHIGVTAIIKDKLYVVHAMDNAKIVISPMLNLEIGDWRISGFWTPDENQ